MKHEPTAPGLPAERLTELIAPGGPPIIADRNRARVAAVLADPVNAWRFEPLSRKRAHLGQRGVLVPADASEDDIDRRLERLIGQDDLLLTNWFSGGQRAAEAVAMIRQPAPATGFLVSDWLLLTNHHVLGTADVAAAAEVLFDYEEDDSGAMHPVRASLDPDRCFLTSPVDQLDYTIVALRPLDDGTPPGQRFGQIPLIGTTGKAVVGQPLNIIQHPDGQTRRVAFRNNRLLSVDEVRLVYETDTSPGSSGSPVLNDRWQLVALHQRSEAARDARGTEIDVNGQPVTPETPDYLRQWVANAGIRISSLVSDLRERELDPPVRELVDQALV